MIFIEKRKAFRKIFIVLLALLAFTMIFTATVGAVDIDFTDSLKVILSKLPLFKKYVDISKIDSSHILIILKLRLPRIILSAIVGATLSIVGATLQSMFKNPMVDSYVLGISSGASFGATLAIVLGFQSITISSFIGSVTTMILVYNIARTGTKAPTNILLLSGIAISFMLNSLVSIMMVFFREQIENIIFWTMGSVATSSWEQIIVIMPVFLVSTLILLSFRRDLNIMSTGEDTANSLGVSVEMVKKILIIISSLLVAISVSMSGVIGFVGLIVPHTVRMFVGSDNRVLLPFSLVVGAIFLIICDTIARSIAPPMEIPVGAITSVVGAPYFIYFLYKNKKKLL